MKKTAILTLLMIFVLTNFTYALDDAPAVQLISPEINQAGQVKHASTINITLKLGDDVDAYMQLVRIDKPKMPFVSEDVLAAISAMASRAPTAWVSYDVAETRDPEPKIDIANLVNAKMSEDELRELYVKQGDEVIAANKAYVQAYHALRKEYSAKELIKLITERRLLANGLDEFYVIRDNYEKQAIKFFVLQDKYNNRFRYTIVSEVSVKRDGPLPYFNYAVSNIETAKYELILRDSKTDHLLMPKRRFVVVD